MGGLMNNHYYEMSFTIHAIVFQTGTELTLSEFCQPFDLNLTTASPSPPLTQLQPPGPPCCSPAVCTPLPGTSCPRFAWLVPSFIQIFSEMWHLREVISELKWPSPSPPTVLVFYQCSRSPLTQSDITCTLSLLILPTQNAHCQRL